MFWNKIVSIIKHPIFTGIFTGIIAIGTLLLWFETNRSVNITREIFESTNRPFLVLEQSPSVYIMDSSALNIEFNITNIGITPSRSILTWVEFLYYKKRSFTEIISKNFSTLYPKEKGFVSYRFEGRQLKKVLRDRSLHKIILKINYLGPSNDRKYKTSVSFITQPNSEVMELYDTEWE